MLAQATHVVRKDKKTNHIATAKQRSQCSPAVFSFFSGIGLLDLAFEDAGFHIAFANELHEPFLNAYQYTKRQMKRFAPEYGYHLGSVSDLLKGSPKQQLHHHMRKTKKDRLTLFLAGPPCPDFSIGGKNRGHTGDNGRLSKTYFGLICEYKPDLFIFENVKGLWRTARHRVFYEEMKHLAMESGYCLTDRLINCIQYGAPQDRERIILIGVRKPLAKQLFGSSSPEILTEIFPWDRYAQFAGDRAFSYPWPTTEPFQEESKRPCPDGLPKTLTVEYWFMKNHVLTHPNAEHCFRPRAGLKRFKTIQEGDDSRKSFKRFHRWRYSPTACYGNNEVHLHPYRPRRITVAEALAVQSMPRRFQLPSEMSLSNMFKAVGNGVPYLAGKAIAKSLLDILGGGENEAYSIQHRTRNQRSQEKRGLQLFQSEE